MKPLTVSVVVNNYNYARFVDQAVRSALDQAFPPGRLEVVVVDDGSNDDSRKVIHAFGGKVKAVYLPHGGQAAALNRGIREAKGDIVSLLDADDWWVPDKLSRVVARFEADPRLGLVQHWTEEVDSGGRPLGGAPPVVPAVYRLEDFLERPLAFTGTTGLSFRRAPLLKLLPIPEALEICADEYLYHGILFHAPVGTIPETLAFRRVHGRNLYAGAYRSREGLERRLKVRQVLRQALEAQLKGRKLSRSPEAGRLEAVGDLTDRLVLHRLRGEWGKAAAAWKEVGSLLSGSYRAFKLAALGLALASPRLYLALGGLYRRLPTLARVRRGLLPD